MGLSVGSSFSRPLLIGTAHGTIAPFRNAFVELGFDFGTVSGETDVGYNLLYPYAHIAYFRPFTEKIGAYAGLGGGFMIGMYKFEAEGDHTENIGVVAATVGVNLFSMIDISYTLRTNFTGFNHKASAGYVYRFK